MKEKIKDIIYDAVPYVAVAYVAVALIIAGILWTAWLADTKGVKLHKPRINQQHHHFQR